MGIMESFDKVCPSGNIMVEMADMQQGSKMQHGMAESFVKDEPLYTTCRSCAHSNQFPENRSELWKCKRSPKIDPVSGEHTHFLCGSINFGDCEKYLAKED